MGLPWNHREGLVKEAQPLGANALCVLKEVGKAKPGEAPLSQQPNMAEAPGLPSDSAPKEAE